MAGKNMVALFRSNVHLRKYFFMTYRSISNYQSNEIPIEVIQSREKDKPVDIPNPYEKPKAQCILCKLNIEPDYKNVRLLSQFVSQFTGRVYGRHITGLCESKQYKLEQEINKSQRAGFMSTYLKDPIYFKDPKLYDPENPLRPHKY